MRISIVADELSADPETAFELGLEWGVGAFELRGVFDARIPRLERHVRDRLVRAVGAFGVEITAVSPGLFKFPLPAAQAQRSNLGWMDREFHRAWSGLADALDDHRRNLLPETIAFARDVGAAYLIGFSFARGGAPAGAIPQQVVDVLAQATEQAAAAGLGLLVETEEGHFANSGALSAELARRVAHPAFGINWDPANAQIEGDRAFPDGYAAVRPFVRNVHFKDVRVEPGGHWELVEEGDVDWAGQIAALAADGYAGAVAVEPHLMPSVASTRRALARLRALVAVSEASHAKVSTN